MIKVIIQCARYLPSLAKSLQLILKISATCITVHHLQVDDLLICRLRAQRVIAKCSVKLCSVRRCAIRYFLQGNA